jgi:hypothetical protein
MMILMPMALCKMMGKGSPDGNKLWRKGKSFKLFAQKLLTTGILTSRWRSPPFTAPTHRAEQATAEAKKQAANATMSKKPRGPPRPRRVSICANDQILGVVTLLPSSSSNDKENQRPCPPPPPPKPTVINPYVTAKKPPRAATTDELSPVDAYFDTFLEYSLGDDPSSATAPRPTTAAPTAAKKRAPPPPPTATLKHVPPPPPHPFTQVLAVTKALITLKAATTTQVLADAKALTTLKAATTTTSTTPATAKEEDELCADLLPDVDVQNADFVQWARCKISYSLQWQVHYQFGPTVFWQHW